MKDQLRTALGLAALAAALGGCATTANPIAPSKPANETGVVIDDASIRRMPYPRWSDFPAAPTNVPAPSQFATRVAETEAARVRLAEAAAGLEWTLANTAEWAASARALVDPSLARPVTPEEAAATEAFAAAARAKATPPPVAK